MFLRLFDTFDSKLIFLEIICAIDHLMQILLLCDRKYHCQCCRKNRDDQMYRISLKPIFRFKEKHDSDMQELQEHMVRLDEEHKQEKIAWTAKLEDELAAASTQHSQQLRAQEHSYKEQLETAEAKLVYLS